MIIGLKIVIFDEFYVGQVSQVFSRSVTKMGSETRAGPGFSITKTGFWIITK